MIGIGNAIGGSVELILFLSLFSLIAIPIISILGLKKMKFVSKSNGTKRISILIFSLYINTTFWTFNNDWFNTIWILLLSDLDKLVIGDCYFIQCNDE